MRQTHLAGEKVFVDYAGQTVPVTDPKTGVIRDAQVFVGALGASQYTVVEATWTQGLEDWVSSHVRMLNFFSGCPEINAVDNVKSGVRSPHNPSRTSTRRSWSSHGTTT